MHGSDLAKKTSAAEQQGCRAGLQHQEDGRNSQAILALMFHRRSAQKQANHIVA